METLKHECGIALIRLRKPLEYYRRKYGTYTYPLDRLYLLMEKQHNRGQEAAGIGVVKLNAPAGYEYAFRERALGTGAIDEIFERVGQALPADLNTLPAGEVDSLVPFIGEIYMGHLRYSTTGRSGMEYTHPFLRRNNWPSRALMLCGNFNMTNVDEIFNAIANTGQHPRLMSDTILLLEQIGNALDKENHRLYRMYRDGMQDPALAARIAAEIDLGNVLEASSPLWDGGYAIVGATGSGSAFAMRDPGGIRPAFYHIDDEIIVVASERPVIQTVFNLAKDDIHELEPGSALLITPDADVDVRPVLKPTGNHRCSFERIYFSRGSDEDIYRERKALGANIVDKVLRAIDHDLDNTVFSFIPNTAEVAYNGMIEELTRRLDDMRLEQIRNLCHSGTTPSDDVLKSILDRKVRTEKVAIKDIKLRTFIAEGSSRNDLATHVYDVTYGTIRPDRDRLVVIDDSIVRGTTLTRSILRIMDRLKPRKIVVVSSSPQVRYPDCYGIDLPNLEELAAFRALMALLIADGRRDLIDKAYEECRLQLESPVCTANVVQPLYAMYTDDEIAAMMATMLRPAEINAEVEIIFQSLDGLHQAVPSSPGDWYFSGDYPTPGGTRTVNRSFADYYNKTFI